MRTKDIKLIIDKDLDRNKDIKNHLFFVSFDSATVSLTVIRYLIELIQKDFGFVPNTEKKFEQCMEFL